MRNIEQEIEARLNQCSKPDGMVDCLILSRKEAIKAIKQFASDCMWDRDLQDRLINEEIKGNGESATN